ncbi:MAG TPA: tRNA uridine-5-carboxymethylaminomethyl(34) synthesis GTPase MnmE [Candidatus Krumholzibacterium sp.]|nr:tRNA uridine-5-carboxymethylaminomethyl(34) synthesis GTPase MnmE [Candidatus Krumholzibacterium sp.]
MDGDTVVALATPPGESGIAVVRISGPDARGILGAMAGGAGEWESHRIHLSRLRDSSGETMDRALAVIMDGPDSYTGEDVAEIYCHGSMHLTSRIIEEAIALGARSAGRGEFTRRAYLNGKIDLVQAEAVADLIASETDLQGRIALAHLEGSLSGKVRDIEQSLLEQLALVEVSIDFSEEEIESWSRARLLEVAGRTREAIGRILDSELAGRKLRNGLRMTIVGPRNAGKSSLYNALVGEERAIVSPVPGTTRDLLRERIHIGGFTYYLEDTAGIAETECEIEAKGISMGMRAASEADIVMIVLDGSQKARGGALDDLRKAEGARHLTVLNKKDLGLVEDAPAFAARTGEKDVIEVSALSGDGLDPLREKIFELTAARGLGGLHAERIAVNARQGAALKEAATALERLERLLADGGEAELVAVELRETIEACGRVTGRSVSEDLLETIFSTFCIGK